MILAACGGGESTAPEKAAEAKPAAKAAAAKDATVYKIQHAHLGRTSATWHAMVEFAKRVSDRTEGQVEFELTGFPELGIDGPDTMRLLKDGTLDNVEIYAGYVGGDWPMIEMSELVALYPDKETKLKVFEAIREEEIRIIREQFNGQVIAYTFYDDQLLFSKKPLRTLEDFKGMKIRVHSTSLADLANNLGAEAQFIPFAEVYAALDRGVVDAGFAGGKGTVGQKWYEIADYLHGPLNSNTHGIITMNLKKWDQLPTDIQQIILEEGQRTTEWIITQLPLWDQEGVDLNLEGDGNSGMEWIKFSPEIASAIRQTAIDVILPQWVERAGGPDTEAVQIFNKLIGPIINVQVNPDGSASAIK
jgi:TRAP-type C4-dicarboxylate transport system substrate-binding protein